MSGGPLAALAAAPACFSVADFACCCCRCGGERAGGGGLLSWFAAERRRRRLALFCTAAALRGMMRRHLLCGWLQQRASYSFTSILLLCYDLMPPRRFLDKGRRLAAAAEASQPRAQHAKCKDKLKALFTKQ